MASVNKVTLIGNLGSDPETRYTASGDAICNIRVATTETWKDKATGEKREATEWHRVVFYRRLAEIAGQYLKKGSSVYLEGRLRTRKWQDKDGNERYTTEIEATEMQMLGGRGTTHADDSASEPSTSRPRNTGGGGGNAEGYGGGSFSGLDPDDIPFVSCGIAADPIFKKHARFA